MKNFSVPEEYQCRSGAVAEFLGHQVVVAFDQQRSVLRHFLVDQLQAAQHSLALLLTHRVLKFQSISISIIITQLLYKSVTSKTNTHNKHMGVGTGFFHLIFVKIILILKKFNLVQNDKQCIVRDS